MSPEVLNHSFLYGGILAGLMFVFIVGSMIYNIELWLNDYPPDIRQKYGPPGERTLRQRKWYGIALLTIMVVVLLAAALQVPVKTVDDPAFMVTFRSTFIVFLMGSLMDLLVIDLLLGMVIRPKFMILPGTEGMAGYRNTKFHFNAFLRGAVSGAVLCLVVTAVAQGILLLV